VGIHEAPLEMYGKIMSISDEMMWRYYELLTDLQVAEIDKMKRDVAAGAAHPMALKKELARRIVADFHTPEAAAKATEDWAKQFQKDEVPENVERVSVEIEKIVLRAIGDLSDESSYFPLQKFQGCTCTPEELRLVGVDRLLAEAGFFSRTEAGRKVKEKAVHIGGHLVDRLVMLLCPKEPLTVRVGRKIKKVTLTSS
jgi:tyrosyl-tRNA synthetase